MVLIMNRLHINTNDKKAVINKNIYGHFAEHLGRCIYNGIFVGEDSDIPNEKGMRKDVVEALRHIKTPVLRWPGGCFADEYHWKDGIGQKNQRKRMVNTHWGGVVEDNSFGTHEFMELCQQLDCEPYINGNLGSGTVQEMSEWVEYLTFNGVSPMAELRRKNGQEEPWKVKYWGVGNENWGCGGNMRPEFYADQYRRYATYIRNYSENKIFKIACGANDFNYNWTDKVMEIAGKYMDALSLHYYTLPSGDWHNKGSATDFTDLEYYTTLKRALKMEELISNHLQIMHKYDPENKVGLIVDEWGTWYTVEPGTNPGFLYQQNTMRDAMVTALTFDIFNHFADRVIMANIAQTVNVLQAVILTEGDKMLLTPTYHVFDLYKEHQNATAVYTFIEMDSETVGIGDEQIPKLSASASVLDSKLYVTLVNPSADAELPVEICLSGIDGEIKGINGTENAHIKAKILTGGIRDYNCFEEPEKVRVENFNGVENIKDKLRITMPACSIIAINIS